MKKYLVTDSNDRIIAINNDDSFHSNGFYFELPDDFDIDFCYDYKIVKGKLVYDSLGMLPFEVSARIAELKQKLADTDYVVIKQIEGATITASEKSRYDDIIAQRQHWRDEINKLEKK